jgi:hypothetical protein
LHPTQWSRGTAVGGPAYPTPYQETGAPLRAFAMRPPFAGHGGQLLNWLFAPKTKKYFHHIKSDNTRMVININILINFLNPLVNFFIGVGDV